MDALSAEEICHIPLNEPFRERFGNPYAVVHRADLHSAIRDACVAHGLVDLRTHHEVTHYEQDGECVTAFIKDQASVEGVALIGADGLNSTIRQQTG